MISEACITLKHLCLLKDTEPAFNCSGMNIIAAHMVTENMPVIKTLWLQAIISLCSAGRLTHGSTLPFIFSFSPLPSAHWPPPFLSLVVNFARGLRLLNLIDYKVSTMASEEGAVHQLLSHCLYKKDYIRRLWPGQEASRLMISALFMTSIQHSVCFTETSTSHVLVICQSQILNTENKYSKLKQ